MKRNASCVGAKITNCLDAQDTFQKNAVAIKNKTSLEKEIIFV